MREVDLLEENAQLHRNYTESLRKRNKELEIDNERLREELRDANTVNVTAFVADGEISVVAVTNNSAEGTELHERIMHKAAAAQGSFSDRSIVFSVIDEVPVNQLHSSPFVR